MLGTVIGSPVSVIVANLVMEEVEDRALASFPSPRDFGNVALMTYVPLSPEGRPPFYYSILTLLNCQFNSHLRWKIMTTVCPFWMSC